jgi:hypothetical protein
MRLSPLHDEYGNTKSPVRQDKLKSVTKELHENKNLKNTKSIKHRARDCSVTPQQSGGIK